MPLSMGASSKGTTNRQCVPSGRTQSCHSLSMLLSDPKFMFSSSMCSRKADESPPALPPLPVTAQKRAFQPKDLSLTPPRAWSWVDSAPEMVSRGAKPGVARLCLELCLA